MKQFIPRIVREIEMQIYTNLNKDDGSKLSGYPHKIHKNFEVPSPPQQSARHSQLILQESRVVREAIKKPLAVV